MKKALCIILCLCFALSLAACGEKTGENGVYYFGKDIDASVFNDVQDPLNPEEVYNSVEYTEEMFYGKYWLDNYDKSYPDYVKTAKYNDIECYNQYGNKEDRLHKEELSILPVKIEAGSANLYGHKIRMDRKYHWAVVSFATKERNYAQEIICSYTVKDNKLLFTPVDYYEELFDENYKSKGIKYTIGKDSLEYSFKFSGPNLTIFKGDDSVTLRSYSASNNTNSFCISGTRKNNSPSIDDLDWISGGAYDKKTTYAYLTKTDGSNVFGGTFKFTEDGLLTLYWTEEDENKNVTKHLRQFVYFGTEQSMTLVDKNNIYYYTESPISKEENALADGLTVEESMGIAELSQSEIDAIKKKKTDLFDELSKEFSSKGINVTINRSTGELSMDSSVLFGGDSSVITTDGKNLLNKFLEVYTNVIFSEKYKGFISETRIEGHTAPVSGSTYESGLPLSEERANNVKNYCLSSETGVDVSKLNSSLKAVGLSNSKPVYDGDGKVDMGASRRVSFRFIINIDK